jgi:hypothetical protein
MGIAFVLFWGICVGIDKSREEGKKRVVEGGGDDGNEYFFFGMFVRRKQTSEGLKPSGQEAEKVRIRIGDER